ncbi:attacin-A-like [Haematobia irritans]|uniref:attacin-A-like n=1 Tax=Haematobia irritans TaxID=7368 RepID=UPI003F4F9A34
MGITLTTNSHGVNNINAFVTQTVGDEKFKTLAGLFVNINLDGTPLIRGVFGEVDFSGNSVGISYAHVSSDGFNWQKNFRLNIFRNLQESIDINIFHNETYFSNPFRLSRYGGNISWSYHEGHSIAFGLSHTSVFNTTAMEGSFKINIWKSQKGSSSLDFTTNIAHFIRGPLQGHQDFMATLTFTYAF